MVKQEAYLDFTVGELYSNKEIINRFSKGRAKQDVVAGFRVSGSEELSDNQLDALLHDESVAVNVYTLGSLLNGIPLSFHEKIGLMIHPKDLEDDVKTGPKLLVFMPVSQEQRYRYRGTVQNPLF